MAYVDGFVFAVADENKEKFIAFAQVTDAAMLDFGATRIVECWGDDVPEGTTTSFEMAVKREPGESVAFSWIEWPDKATRDAGMARMMADPRFDPATNPMPFDGKRMIFGGFEPVFEVSR